MLAILLFGNVFTKFTLGRKQSAVYNLERFIVLGIGQRRLPQSFLKRNASRTHFSTAPRALTSPASSAQNSSLI